MIQLIKNLKNLDAYNIETRKEIHSINRISCSLVESNIINLFMNMRKTGHL